MFKVLEDNVGQIMTSVGLTGSPIDGSFDVHQLWSDDMTFSKSGFLFCGKPFPRSNNIRFVDRIFYQEDHKGANQDELDALPSEFSFYCFENFQVPKISNILTPLLIFCAQFAHEITINMLFSYN